MNVELITGTPKPEELVATAARNDYRSEGVTGYSFRGLMQDASDPDEKHLEALSEQGWNWEKNGTPRELEAKKRTLIDHLMRSDHWGPFEHPQATIVIEDVTRVLMAQLTRHRHATYDVMSLRYVNVDDLEDDDSREGLEERFQFPEFIDAGEIVSRDEGPQEIDADYVERYYKAAYSACVDWYRSLIDAGVPPEEARKVLPMGTKVNIVVSMNARAWMHVLAVRTKADVQGETRRAADRVLEELEEWMPYTFGKFREMQPIRVSP